MNPKSLKLTIELVPSTAWGQNLRKLLKPYMWSKIRKDVLDHANGKCMICNTVTKLDCHEVWHYDDKKHVQRLTGFLALCTDCHSVKHIGLTGLQKGAKGYDKVVQHFIKVNKCTKIDFIKHYRLQMDLFRKRSRFEWKLELNT